MIIYNILLMILFPLICFIFYRKDSKDKLNFMQRMGFNYPIIDKLKPLIWVHAVSIGEVRAATEIIKNLQNKYPNYNILITNMTASGQKITNETFDNITVVLLPLDYPWVVKRFFKYFNPSLGLILETEIWPNLLHYAKLNFVKLVLANARMSDKSCNGYLRFAKFSENIINKFDLILAQDQNSLNNFIKLKYIYGIDVIGNTKFDCKLPEIINDLSYIKNNRKIITFASSRDGEENMILQHADKLKDYLLLIVPRHDYRFSEISLMLQNKNIKYQTRSSNINIKDDTQVLLGDSVGEMFSYYQISDVVIMGGSFADFGCQNPLEPLLLNVPVIVGPSIYNFKKICNDLFIDKVAISVLDMDNAIQNAIYLLENSEIYIKNQSKIQIFLDKYKGASNKIVSKLELFIK